MRPLTRLRLGRPLDGQGRGEGGRRNVGAPGLLLIFANRRVSPHALCSATLCVPWFGEDQ